MQLKSLQFLSDLLCQSNWSLRTLKLAATGNVTEKFIKCDSPFLSFCSVVVTDSVSTSNSHNLNLIYRIVETSTWLELMSQIWWFTLRKAKRPVTQLELKHQWFVKTALHSQNPLGLNQSNIIQSNCRREPKTTYVSLLNWSRKESCFIRIQKQWSGKKKKKWFAVWKSAPKKRRKLRLNC